MVWNCSINSALDTDQSPPKYLIHLVVEHFLEQLVEQLLQQPDDLGRNPAISNKKYIYSMSTSKKTKKEKRTGNGPISETRLGKFWKFLSKMTLKSIKILCEFWGCFKNSHFEVKIAGATFWATLGDFWATLYSQILSHWTQMKKVKINPFYSKVYIFLWK